MVFPLPAVMMTLDPHARLSLLLPSLVVLLCPPLFSLGFFLWLQYHLAFLSVSLQLLLSALSSGDPPSDLESPWCFCVEFPKNFCQKPMITNNPCAVLGLSCTNLIFLLVQLVLL